MPASNRAAYAPRLKPNRNSRSPGSHVCIRYWYACVTCRSRSVANASARHRLSVRVTRSHVPGSGNVPTPGL